jgi:hypothetical protein
VGTDPKNGFWTYADKAMLGVCEALALLFMLPFGEDLYGDKPITGWHSFYLTIGLLFAVVGPIWPWIRTRSWISRTLVASLSGAAANAYVWLTVLLLLFLYNVGPELYHQAVHEPATADDIAKAIAPLQAEIANLKKQLADAAQRIEPKTTAPLPPNAGESGGLISWALDGQFLVVTGGGPEARINSVLLQGTSTTSVSIKEAYAVSELTGHQQDLMANVQYKGYYPVDKVDIPPQAPVWLELLWKPPLLIRDFLDQWGKFRVAIIYSDGTSFEHEFDEGYVRRKLQQQIPDAFGPRVTPRDNK